MTTDEETRAMSRLLTQGATMLDEACDDCGNPLFRHKGELVCAVCARRAETGERGGKRNGGEARTGEDESDGVAPSEVDEADVEDHLRMLAERLARDAAESADEPAAVERRLDLLERTLELLR